MNEAETRAEHVDPALKAAGWGVVEGSRVRREVPIPPGRIEGLGRRGKGLTADYVLEYRNTKMAVIEAKAWNAEGEVEAGKRYEEKDFNKIIESAWDFPFADQSARKDVGLLRDAGACACGARPRQPDEDRHRSELLPARYGRRRGARRAAPARLSDNEKTIPTILTTSQKLSTGVDARDIRNIVLMRPVNSMIEFKQIIGRGTRLYDGKDYFTIYDFVKAHHHSATPNGTASRSNRSRRSLRTRRPNRRCRAASKSRRRTTKKRRRSISRTARRATSST